MHKSKAFRNLTPFCIKFQEFKINIWPFQLVVMMGIRKGLDRFFDKSELKILDDILPESQRHEVLDDEEALEGGIEVS